MIIFIFIAVAFTICLILVFGLVSPKKEMIVSSEILIDRPKNMVLDCVKLLRHQEQYNAWIRNDPEIKMEYKGTDGAPGFVAGWESKTRMGSGEQEILSVTNDGYESELRFQNHDNVTHVKTILESVSDKTKVFYTMTATPGFPMNMMAPMMKNMLKKDMDETLTTLKKILEQ
jgi:hypothetical protein